MKRIALEEEKVVSQEFAHEQSQDFDSKAVTALLIQILRSRIVNPKEEGLPYSEQVRKFLVETNPKNAKSLQELGLSEEYRFGYRIHRYPQYVANQDNRDVVAAKAKNLQRIGVDQRTAESFVKLADPTWGSTFRGIRMDEAGVDFMLDRTHTYAPFRQTLELTTDAKTGKSIWKYAFTLFNPKSLYFHIPTDTMGVNSPEFHRASYQWEELCLSGSVGRKGQLEFENVKFGNMIGTTGVPNYRVKHMSKSRIMLEQLRDGVANENHTDYTVTSTTFKNLLAFIRQEDYQIDTNPLFSVAVKKGRNSANKK